MQSVKILSGVKAARQGHSKINRKMSFYLLLICSSSNRCLWLRIIQAKPSENIACTKKNYWYPTFLLLQNSHSLKESSCTNNYWKIKIQQEKLACLTRQSVCTSTTIYLQTKPIFFRIALLTTTLICREKIHKNNK
jgi:hypothetical protein